MPGNTLYCVVLTYIFETSLGKTMALYILAQFWYSFGTVVSPGVSGVIFTLVLVQWCGSLLASNAHLGDSPLARASHCIMPRTDLYTRLHCVAICITVSSIAQCTWHPICGRALYNAHHQRDSKMCTNIYIICIKAISISALDK